MHAVVANKDKQRVGKVGRVAGFAYGFADGVIGVEEMVEFCQLEARRYRRVRRERIDPTARIFPRRVQRHREDSSKKTAAFVVQPAKFLIRARKQVFVGNAPGTVKTGLPKSFSSMKRSNPLARKKTRIWSTIPWPP